MLPIIWAVVRKNIPYIVWPFSAVIGFIGYKLEKAFNNNVNVKDQRISISDERLKRQLDDIFKEDKDIKSSKSDYGIFKK